jgi:hypothetical protein
MSLDAVRTASAGAAFWVAATRDGSPGPLAITGPAPDIDVTLTAPLPVGTRAVTGPRGVVVLARSVYYDHEPSQAELSTPPSIPAVTVQGIALARDGRFHPRKFTAVLTPSTPTYVVLRPTLMATRIGEAGAVILTLQWSSGAAASWSIVLLTCTRNGNKLGFSAQADINGDVIIPLTGLPPLAASQSNDLMTMTVQADQAQAGVAVNDPDALKPVTVSIGGAFAANQTLTIVRGTITKGRDLGIAAVRLQ